MSLCPTRIRTAFLLLICAIVLSCAKERDPVDRVQPYALDKAFFIGEDFTDTRDDPEFYSRNHIIDVGYGANGASDAIFTSSWAEPVGRIKWQITENYLIARSSFERIEGSDGKGSVKYDDTGNPIGSATNDGIIVAMFAIESHFDIVNDYNPTTGEQLNVVVENDQDRPWNERQYMRVDWSANLNTDSYDFDVLSMISAIDGVEYEPVSYYVEDPEDDQAPHFAMDEGYFDVTTKAFARPKQIDLSSLGWGAGEVPACFFSNEILGGSFPIGNCNPVEFTLRHSFVKLDRDGDGIEDSDYEPREYDGQRFEHFGGFYHERFGYDRTHGLVDDKWHRMLNRYNLWHRSHYYEDEDKMTGFTECHSNVDSNDNGTADACEEITAKTDFGGSQCSLFKGRCTLPYRARTAVPIPFYYTDTGNPDYFESSELAVHEWDIALRAAVQTAKYTECVRVEGDKEGCRDAYPMWRGQMDDQLDAVQLALEVDDCRTGRAYTEKNKKGCEALADEIGDKRCVGGSARCISKAVREIAKLPEMLVLCHSPVAFDDPEICGEARMPEGADAAICTAANNYEEGDELDVDLKLVIAKNETLKNVHDLAEGCNKALRVRHGDLRYHVVNIIEAPQKPSPWGIMVSSIDPLTGENIATNCNVWSHVTDAATQKYVDQMRLIKGEITPEDVTNATDVSEWVSAADAASRGGSFGTMSKSQVSATLSSYAAGKRDPSFLDDIADGMVGGKPFTEDELAAARAISKAAFDVRADSRVTDPHRAAVEARKQAAAGTSFEAALMTKAVLQRAGTENLPLTDAVMDQASPLRGGDPRLQVDLKKMMQEVMHTKNACFLSEDNMAETPLALAPLADIMEEKFGKFNSEDPLSVQYERAEKMRKYLAHLLHYGVLAHELGHSMAHRHNFVGSADPWSYHPQYWQLRTRDGEVDRPCDDVSEDGKACVGPRYLDPLTEEERDNLIHMFMLSSIMDYPGEPTQDFLGPGIWDFAATRMFYGDAVSVIDEDDFYGDAGRIGGVKDRIRHGFGGMLGITYSLSTRRSWEPIHYSALQDRFSMIKDCETVDDLDAFVPARYDAERFGRWSPLLDGRIVAPEGGDRYTKCRQHEVDYVSWTELGKASGATIPDPKTNPFDTEERIMAPYSFGTDNWADIGNVSVYRHDNGADLYEIFNFMITQKELSAIFDKYRRNRSDFSVRYVSNRMLNRYSLKLKEGAKGMAFYRSLYEELGIEEGRNPSRYFQLDIAGFSSIHPNIIASTYAFDFFARELARPEAGSHNFSLRETEPILRYNGTSGDFRYGATASGRAVVIPNGPQGAWGMMSSGGELLQNQLDRTKGEFDTDYTLNCGSYYDKMYVGMLLSESEDNFISSDREDFYDSRWRSTSLAELFPDGYRRLIGNALTNDDHIKGPRIQVNANGDPLVHRVDGEPMPDAPIGWTSWWGDEATHCFPIKGQNVCGDFLGNWDDEPALYSVPIDPQIGWEQQKFLIAMSLLYIPENQKQNWIDQFMIYELGRDADPNIENRIELHHPDGRIYVARTFGKETLFGKTVQKGIAARVLEYANTLLNQAYETESVDLDDDGVPEWYRSVVGEDGRPIVRFDPNMDASYTADPENCNETTSTGCTCEDNRACMALDNYMSIPAFLWEAIRAYYMTGGDVKGIYG